MTFKTLSYKHAFQLSVHFKADLQIVNRSGGFWVDVYAVCVCVSAVCVCVWCVCVCVCLLCVSSVGMQHLLGPQYVNEPHLPPPVCEIGRAQL